VPIIYAQYLYWYWYLKVTYLYWYWYLKFTYWYWYWYLKVRYWYLYWYLDHWYWYWYLFVEYLIHDCYEAVVVESVVTFSVTLMQVRSVCFLENSLSTQMT